jgi:hypothetical protein
VLRCGDALLPELLSGRIRVSEAGEAIDATLAWQARQSGGHLDDDAAEEMEDAERAQFGGSDAAGAASAP